VNNVHNVNTNTTANLTYIECDCRRLSYPCSTVVGAENTKTFCYLLIGALHGVKTILYAFSYGLW